MSLPIARLVLVLFLPLSLTGCGWRLSKPSTSPPSLPVVCLPAALERCAGVGVTVPEVLSADTAALIGELAVRALIACSVRHDELRRCVADHNGKAR